MAAERVDVVLAPLLSRVTTMTGRRYAHFLAFCEMCTPRDLKAQKYCLVPSVSSLGLPSACRQTTIQSYVHLKLSSYRHKRMRCGPHLILLRTNWQVVHKAINACIAPLCSVDGCHVITVEGIGKIESGLHPVQVPLPSFLFLSLACLLCVFAS